jgi:Asp/Glu/hydantoin racemase
LLEQRRWWKGGKTAEFIEAAKKLEARGVKAIAGDCGFISIYQKDIAKAVSVPVVTSSLMQVPLVYRMLAEEQKVGILTASTTRLGEKQFNAVGWSSKDIPVVIKSWGDKEWDPIMGRDGIPQSEIVKAAKELAQENPDVGAIVIECSVMPRYTHAIQKATGLPVFDITTLIKLVYSAVDPPDYSQD